MELHELLGRESLRPLQYLARALILPHLYFLFVGQGQDTQREHFSEPSKSGPGLSGAICG